MTQRQRGLLTLDEHTAAVAGLVVAGAADACDGDREVGTNSPILLHKAHSPAAGLGVAAWAYPQHNCHSVSFSPTDWPFRSPRVCREDGDVDMPYDVHRAVVAAAAVHSLQTTLDQEVLL